MYKIYMRRFGKVLYHPRRVWNTVIWFHKALKYSILYIHHTVQYNRHVFSQVCFHPINRLRINWLYLLQSGIYPTCLPQAGGDTSSIFKWSKAGLNSKFSFSWTVYSSKAKEYSLFYYSNRPWVQRRNGFMPFPRALAYSEMQTASSRFWT